MDLYLTNTITRKKEKFEAIKPPQVGMYTCGMTVYDYAHIGHGRKYVTDDVLKRVLTLNGYDVNHVQNVTDVGHLSSDADTGEDKLEKGATKFGKTVWEVAEYFTNNFYESMDALNIIRPSVICKATDNISEQIQMVQKLIDNGFAYDSPEAVYFDVSKFPEYGNAFGQKLSEKRVGMREEVQVDENKRNPQDFALWFKRVGKFENHTMHWDSPWGDGFPGWHIECSAMSVKYLGEQFEIHTGGEDHISIHHPNEIAQSEAASGKSPFVKYWIHTAFLMVDGTKMSKSLGNFYTIEDVVKRGFDPISLRYLYLTAHYRDPLNFTWTSLEGASQALKRLRSFVQNLKQSERNILSTEKEDKIEDYKDRFIRAVNDDLNTALAISVVWEVVKSNIPSEDKYDLIMFFDSVLGLNLQKSIEESSEEKIPDDVNLLVKKREEYKSQKMFKEADEIRSDVLSLGYKIEDAVDGVRVVKV